jgi:hypothetical protein
MRPCIYFNNVKVYLGLIYFYLELENTNFWLHVQVFFGGITPLLFL